MKKQPFTPGDPRLFDDRHVFCYRNLGEQCAGCPTQQYCDDNHSTSKPDMPSDEIISRRTYLINLGYEADFIALKSDEELISLSSACDYEELH